jgi:hypothetical protein
VVEGGDWEIVRCGGIGGRVRMLGENGECRGVWKREEVGRLWGEKVCVEEGRDWEIGGC